MTESIPNSIAAFFAEPIKVENEKFSARIAERSKLINEQKTLNESLADIARLKGIAEEGSPAMIKLNEQERQFSQLLDVNLQNLAKLKQ